MKKMTKNLTTLLYVMLFGVAIAALSGSLGIGVVFATLLLFGIKTSRLPKGSLAINPGESEDEIVKEISGKVKEIRDLIDKKADNLEIEKLKLELGELRAKAESENQTKLKAQIDDLAVKLDATETELARIKEEAKNGTPKPGSLQSELKAKMNDLKEIAKKESSKEIEVKALTLRANITNDQNAFDLPDIGQLATRKLSMYDIFPKMTIGKGTHKGSIRYYDWDEDTIVRAAAAVAEGVAFPESTAKFKKGSIDLQKVGDTLPVTEEFFEDEEMFAAELGLFLETNVKLEIDRQLALGDGTGNTMTGLLASVGAYTPVASSIQDASIYDLIVKVKEAITTTGGSKYTPDVIIMNISDINKYKLKKDNNDNYVLPPFVSRDGNNIDGMAVIEANIITANTMVIGDRRFGRIYEMPGMTIEKGYVNTQFTEDEMTLKIRKRMAFLIRSADAGGFKKVTDITAALTTLAS